MLEWLAHSVAPWNRIYADSALLSTVLVFVHLGAVLIAGGLAVNADRNTLAGWRDPDAREIHLRNAPAIHRTVVGALTVVVSAGVLLFLADVEALAGSVFFRIKAILVFTLLTNGYMMVRFERKLEREPTAVDSGNSWRSLALTARFSQALWFATVLAGVTLRNV